MSRAIATELPADRAGVNAAVPIPATRLPERVAPTPRPRPRPADHRQPDPRGSPVLLRAAALTEAHAVRDAGRLATDPEHEVPIKEALQPKDLSLREGCFYVCQVDSGDPFSRSR